LPKRFYYIAYRAVNNLQKTKFIKTLLTGLINMPELPEVETITNALKPVITGRKFTNIEIFFPRLRYELTVHQSPELLNTKVAEIRRRARYTIIELKNRNAIIFHYGMTGAVRVCKPEVPRLKHEHVIFHLDDGMTLRFEDPRRFGFIQQVKLKKAGADPEELSHLGPEPLTKNFTAKHLQKAFEKKTMPIKTAIMDNAIVVGVGNIYANEALFMTGINPTTPANKLTEEQLKQFVETIKKTLKKAIKAGGTTIADFKGVDGSEGKFNQELLVYGKSGEKCTKCDDTIVKIKQSGRASFYCPTCQPSSQ